MNGHKVFLMSPNAANQRLIYSRAIAIELRILERVEQLPKALCHTKWLDGVDGPCSYVRGRRKQRGDRANVVSSVQASGGTGVATGSPRSRRHHGVMIGMTKKKIATAVITPAIGRLKKIPSEPWDIIKL